MWANYRLSSSGAPRRARRSSQSLDSALTRSVLESIGAPASLLRLAGDGPGVRHRTQVPEFVGVDQRVDGLDPPVEYVERPGVEDLVVPVAEDRARLAVDLVWLERHVDPGHRRDDGGEQSGHVRGADDGPGQLRGLPAAVPDQLDVGGEQPPQTVDRKSVV